jgi:hypothetical protein
VKLAAMSIVFALPAALGAADLKIDHATVCGANVDAMRKALSAVGNLPSEYGGPHGNHATEMALVSFPDGSFLELMGIQAKADPAAVAGHVWSKFLRNDAGACAFALRVTDLSGEVARLKSAGIRVGTPESSGRTLPNGTRISWETVDAGPGARGGLFPFLIRGITAREKRAFPSGKATTDRFAGIGKVVVGVGDMEGAIAQYRKAFQAEEPRRLRDAAFGAARVVRGYAHRAGEGNRERFVVESAGARIWQCALCVRARIDGRRGGCGASFELVRACGFVDGRRSTGMAFGV